MSSSIADIINGIPRPIEYNNIRTIPLKTFWCVATSNSAELKKLPIHGVQLIENKKPNINDLKKFKFSLLNFNLLVLFKKLIFNIPI